MEGLGFRPHRQSDGASGNEYKIAPLYPADAQTLRLPWLSRFNANTLADHLRAYPGMSLWVPETGEHIIAEQWRHRDDIASVAEVNARRARRALIEALHERLRATQIRLLLVADEAWAGNGREFAEAGHGLLQTIVFFERNLRGGTGVRADMSLPPVDLRRAGLRDLDTLLELDHNSFPWLWWNSSADMEQYMQLPGVHVLIARHLGRDVGYASFTLYEGWAHLDRLAVVEREQGKGFGAAQLAAVLRIMSDAGARQVALSTQEHNVKSHKLYRAFGFGLSPRKMRLNGLKLDPTAPIE